MANGEEENPDPLQPIGEPIDFGSPDKQELERDTGRLYQRTFVRQDETWWLHFTRNALALGLALLLGILTITVLVAAIAGADAERLSQVSQVTITPVVALCGTAFGFYFAQQAAASAARRVKDLLPETGASESGDD